MVAGVKRVVGGRAEAGDNEQVAAAGEQRLHRLAAIKQRILHHHLVSVHFLRPSMRCEIRIAIGWSLSKASEQAAETTSSASSGCSRRNTVTPMISKACAVA